MTRTIRTLLVAAALAACGGPAETLVAQDPAPGPAPGSDPPATDDPSPPPENPGPSPDLLAGVEGTLVVVNKGANSVSIVDVSEISIVATLPTGQGPHEVALSSDGRTAVVTDYGNQTGGRTLTVIDVAGLRVSHTINLGAHTRPHGIAFLPGDQHVAVTTEGSAHVLIVRVDSGDIENELPTVGQVSHMLAIPAIPSLIYTSDIGDGTVTELDITSGGVARKFNVPVTPEAIGVTPDGTEVWVGSNDLGLVSVIDTGSGAVNSGVLSGFGFPYRVLFSADASLVLIPDFFGNELRFVDRGSRQELATLTFPGGGPQGITFSADESVIFQVLSSEDRVAVIDASTREVIGYVPAGNRPDGVAHTSLNVD